MGRSTFRRSGRHGSMPLRLNRPYEGKTPKTGADQYRLQRAVEKRWYRFQRNDGLVRSGGIRGVA
jgi:hypothetical protein